jgi:hypothetical protein
VVDGKLGLLLERITKALVILAVLSFIIICPELICGAVVSVVLFLVHTLLAWVFLITLACCRVARFFVSFYSVGIAETIGQWSFPVTLSQDGGCWTICIQPR